MLEERWSEITDCQQKTLDLVTRVVNTYALSALNPLLTSCREAVRRSDFLVAVLGRFKAGKSSFLNHLIGRNILPVGVVPVTSVVTEISYGKEDRVQIQFHNGRTAQGSLTDLPSFVMEPENPQNQKRVASVSVQVPELARWPGVRLIDTPGVDSTFIHNTETSLAWAPQVDVALVAVGVDPPLSKQDIDLIRKLSTYTAHLAVLLTKVDLLSPSEEQEVLVFVRSQLKQALGEEIPVYPYSTWAGYEHWRIHFQEAYMAPLSADTDRRKQEIISHKLAALVADCQSYLQLAQNAAEASQSKRLEFRTQTVVQKEFVADTRLSMQLTARQAMAGIRASISNELLPNERIIVQELLESFAQAKPDFPRNFGPMLAAFENWLQMALTTSLTDLSERKRADLAQPVAGLQQQYQRLLQAFRDQLSERTMALWALPCARLNPRLL